jgi:uncharacterized protein
MTGVPVPAKTVFENVKALAQEVPSAIETQPKNVGKDTFLPFHPGAIRFYREVGINLPRALAAAEMK